LLLAPLRLEAIAMRRGAPDADIERIGMGPVAATAARVRLAQRERAGRPLLLAGLGGGLHERLRPGAVVVATSIGSVQTGEAVALRGATEVAELLEHAGLRAHLGPVVCSPKILHGAEARRDAASAGALAVEMEALWLTPLAERHPFAVVRVVLDTPGAELSSLATPGAALRALRVLRECAAALCNWSPAQFASVSDKELVDP
jgi:4-hydroxy-3-methylbut-2-enyl diphosphate reductase